MVWVKGETDLATTLVRKRSPRALGGLRMINVVLQYILLNSELTVSFLLLQIYRKRKEREKRK